MRTGLGLVVVAPSAAAQSRLSTELFIARNPALAPGLSMYGVGLMLSGGALGLRASGSAAFTSTSTSTGRTVDVDAWAGDLDLVLQPASLVGGGGRAVVALAPYVFAGVGRIASTDFDGFRTGWTAAGYGAGLGVPLGGVLGVSAEARYRLPLSEAVDESNETYESSFPRGWEYRFGLSISLGG